MPDNDWDDPNESQGMKNMRQQLKEQAKQIKQYQEQMNLFQAQNRGNVIGQALSSRGLDPRVAKFYPADLGTDDESVGKWCDENKDLFGVAQPSSVPEDDRGTLSEAERRGYQAMQDMEAYDARVVQDFKSQIDQIKYDPTNPDKAEADLLAILSANGVNLASM
jgi:hypothetical protein